MKLYYYRGPKPNFGDDLNNVLMPMVFPGFFDEDEGVLFLAIGSVLFDHHPSGAVKIVFGSGYGQYTAVPRLDDRWKVYCVRGPLTAASLGLDVRTVAADAAVLANRHLRRPVKKRYRFSYMPHWQSLLRGNWSEVCKLANIEFIDPAWPVENVIDKILASETVITEAMHGAIVADALRIPWIPVLPFHQSHRFKWQDWAGALEVDLTHHKVFPVSVQDLWIALTGRNGSWVSHGNRFIKATVRPVDAAMRYAAARDLNRLTRAEPLLSKDSALDRAVTKLEEAADRIKQDFCL